jgi:hypothetical protein
MAILTGLPARRPGMVSSGCGDADEIVLIACAGVHRHSCLAKEDPDNDASACMITGGTGSLHERRPMRPNQTHSVSLL